MFRQITEYNLVANRWYAGTEIQRRSRYPSPQTLLRQSLGATELRATDTAIVARHIRAAAVIPPGCAYHSLTLTPWTLIYRTAQWTMLIVSVEDIAQWINQARQCGAVAWQRNHSQSQVYRWQRPAVKTAEQHPLYDRQRKDYDRASIEQAIDQGINYSRIAEQYGVARMTVQRIADRRQAKQHRG